MASNNMNKTPGAPNGWNGQQGAWDREYRAQQLLSPSMVPQADVMRFVRWLKKEQKKYGERLDIETLSVLDLGAGTGRNALYFAEQGATVYAFEFAPRALAFAKEYCERQGITINYRLHDIGTPYALEDDSIDIALDVTSSNSLSDQARRVYLNEVARVLKPGGYLFLRALSLEADAHAKELVKRSPGPDPDTYVHPDLAIVEKVFTRESLLETYTPYLTSRFLERAEHYATVAGRKYKRSYWLGYFQKVEVEDETHGGVDGLKKAA